MTKTNKLRRYLVIKHRRTVGSVFLDFDGVWVACWVHSRFPCAKNEFFSVCWNRYPENMTCRADSNLDRRSMSKRPTTETKERRSVPRGWRHRCGSSNATWSHRHRRQRGSGASGYVGAGSDGVWIHVARMPERMLESDADAIKNNIE